MSFLKKVEKQVEGWYKGAPSMNDSAKESLASAWPVIALVFGVLQLLAAWALWGVMRAADGFLNQANELARIYSTRPYILTSGERTIIYLGIIVLLVSAVILLMAYTPLKARARRGWDLLFLGSLINVVYAGLQLITYDRGFGSFIFSLLGSAIAFYLLFQVKGKFTK